MESSEQMFNKDDMELDVFSKPSIGTVHDVAQNFYKLIDMIDPVISPPEFDKASSVQRETKITLIDTRLDSTHQSDGTDFNVQSDKSFTPTDTWLESTHRSDGTDLIENANDAIADSSTLVIRYLCSLFN